MQATLEHMTVWGLISDASLLVKAVMLTLLLASLLSWYLILVRSSVLKRRERRLDGFLQRFRSAADLAPLLNVAERAVARLEMTHESIRFSARFGGVSHTVSVPISAVLAIYARETGQGMALPEDMVPGDADADADDVVSGEEEVPSVAPAAGRPTLSAVPDAADADDGDEGGDDPAGPDSPRPRPGGPFLRVVK